jgi:hypothetical protein
MMSGNGDQHHIYPNSISEILEDSISGILEGILTSSNPVDRKQDQHSFHLTILVSFPF